MNLRRMTIGIAASLLITSSLAATTPTITAHLRLQDMNHHDLTPISTNTWQLVVGQQFKVVISGEVSNPLFTDNLHTMPQWNNQPLGICSLVGSLLTSGVNVIIPDTDTAYTPPRWLNYSRLHIMTLSFVNSLDKDSDGDLDVAGAGMSFPYADLTDLGDIVPFEAGALGGWTDISRGSYHATKVGTTNLTFAVTDSTVYQDAPQAGDLVLPSLSCPAINAAINIQVVDVPEPVFGLPLVGLACLALRPRR